MEEAVLRESRPARNGASVSLLNVYLAPLAFNGLPSPTLPIDAMEGESLSESGFKGEPLLLAGVASRSSQLMRLARSFVAAAASETDNATELGNEIVLCKADERDETLPSAASDIPLGRIFDNSCSDIGRGRAFVFFIGVSEVSLSQVMSHPLRVTSSTLTSGLPRTGTDRKSTRLNSSHSGESRMPSSA